MYKHFRAGFGCKDGRAVPGIQQLADIIPGKSSEFLKMKQQGSEFFFKIQEIRLLSQSLDLIVAAEDLQFREPVPDQFEVLVIGTENIKGMYRFDMDGFLAH